jgi:hypothetical protein
VFKDLKFIFQLFCFHLRISSLELALRGRVELERAGMKRKGLLSRFVLKIYFSYR